MILRVLGSGTVKTARLKNCSGYLINDEFLLDCGPGIWRALGTNNIMNSQIKYIALSHFHPDHVSDLAPFLLERYLNIAEKLTLLGPIGLKKWFNDFSKLFGEWIQTMVIEIIEMDSDTEIDKYKIQTLLTEHTENSICYRIEDSEKKVLFYSGDSGENENIKKLSQNADLGVFEASNTIATKIESHLTPEIAVDIASKSNVKKLMLTHFYPEVYDSVSLKKAKKIFNGEMIIAEDNMIVEI
jgi:ribonuclease BN (tRNA processing enzyme)